MPGFGEDCLGHLFTLAHNDKNRLFLKSEENSIKAEMALYNKELQAHYAL